MTVHRLESEPKAKQVTFKETEMVLALTDGRTHPVPLDWYPSLKLAPRSIREDYALVHDGLYVEWQPLGLTLLVSALLVARGPLQRWDQ